MVEEKFCTTCCTEKGGACFSKDRSSKDGLQSKCKLCHREYVILNKDKIAAQRKIMYAKNRAKIKAEQAEYYKENKERIIRRVTTFQKENKEKVRGYKRKWKSNNKGLVNSATRKRQAAQANRTARWGNQFLIDLQYIMAVKITELLNVKYHVDHIIPLQGESVSGLHVENNLRVIKAWDNLSKGNKYAV